MGPGTIIVWVLFPLNLIMSLGMGLGYSDLSDKPTAIILLKCINKTEITGYCDNKKMGLPVVVGKYTIASARPAGMGSPNNTAKSPNDDD